MVYMHPIFDRRNRRTLLLHIVKWAQRKGLRVETLTKDQVAEAIRCKPLTT
jgi:hypothetical protein